MSGLLRLLRGLAAAIALAYLGFTVASSLGSFHWLAELLTHFRVQAAIAGAALALICATLRLRAVTAGVCALTLLHLLPVLLYLVPRESPDLDGIPRLRVLQLNVHTANRRHAAVEQLVREARPDLLALLEVNERWLEALSGLHTHYPHRIGRPQEDNFGIALFSRFPIDDLRLLPLQDERTYMITGRFSLGDTPVTIALAHLVPPSSASWAALRNRQLDALSQLTAGDSVTETLLLGDLNTTPWSPFHDRLERSSGLRNGARGLGLYPSWPAGFLPLRIPLDHFLLSPGLHVASLELGPDVGSDHLPVLLEITPGPG
jgi:endonuclease/exonuclease/phosphatase (EEP) superfamily protein YafD